MTMPTNRMQEMIRDYRRLRSVVPLGTLRTKKDYDRAVASLDAILDEIGEDEKHPLAELADAIGASSSRSTSPSTCACAPLLPRSFSST